MFERGGRARRRKVRNSRRRKEGEKGRRTHVHHVQEGSLGGSNSSSSGNDLNVGDDLDGTPSNLGGDGEGLEEGGLSGLHSGVSSRDPNVDGSEGSSSSRGGDLVGEDVLSNLLKVSGGEDESDVSLDVGEKLLELRVLGENGSESSSNHGVLSHEDGGLSSERLSDLMHCRGQRGGRGKRRE